MLGINTSAHALTWLGYDTPGGSGNDKESDVEAFVASATGQSVDLTNLGKSLSGFNVSFTGSKNDRGTVTYTGPLSIAYLTVKVGNVKGIGKGYHLYKFMNGSFNLMSDPNPDFPTQGNEWSHYTAWGAPATPVSDSGTTFAVLGAALLGLIAFRSRKS